MCSRCLLTSFFSLTIDRSGLIPRDSLIYYINLLTDYHQENIAPSSLSSLGNYKNRSKRKEMRKWAKDNNQMKIIVIIILVACVTTSPILASLVDHIPHDDQDGILKCIFDRDNPSFCGNETQDNFKCYSSYASFKLCLISNECQYKLDDPEISLDCWNCWVNLITDATEVQEFQKKIQSCAAYEGYMGIYVAVLVFLLTLLAL